MRTLLGGASIMKAEDDYNQHAGQNFVTRFEINKQCPLECDFGPKSLGNRAGEEQDDKPLLPNLLRAPTVRGSLTKQLVSG
ncbi:TPA: hypothetical protein ACH3X2_007766 [Trebouxia sp. C0005]